MFIELLGYTAAVLTTMSFVPQAIQTWKTKETKDISLPMYLGLTLGIFLWFLYGLMIHSWPVIIANALAFIFAACILSLKFKHG